MPAARRAGAERGRLNRRQPHPGGRHCARTLQGTFKTCACQMSSSQSSASGETSPNDGMYQQPSRGRAQEYVRRPPQCMRLETRALFAIYCAVCMKWERRERRPGLKSRAPRACAGSCMTRLWSSPAPGAAWAATPGKPRGATRRCSCTRARRARARRSVRARARARACSCCLSAPRRAAGRCPPAPPSQFH